MLSAAVFSQIAFGIFANGVCFHLETSFLLRYCKAWEYPKPCIFVHRPAQGNAKKAVRGPYKEQEKLPVRFDYSAAASSSSNTMKSHNLLDVLLPHPPERASNSMFCTEGSLPKDSSKLPEAFALG